MPQGVPRELSGAFPDPFVRAFAVGEQTGELDRELLRIGGKYRDAALRGMEAVAEWVPRLIYIGIMLYVGWRIVSAYAGRMKDIQNMLGQ